MFMKDLSREILAYALQNAIEFGKADAGRILPKLFQHGLEKQEISKIMPLIASTVKKVNSVSAAEREKTFAEMQDVVKKREEKEKDLPELELTGKVVTRMAPEPSKYLHVGHAMTFLINYLYAQKYKGTCLLRLEDTNPEKVSQEYVDSILDDIENYLGMKIKKPRYVSDDMPKLYKYAEKLIKSGNAYICFCKREAMQDMRHKGIECQCRQFPVKIQHARWKEFVQGKYPEGEAVMRLKGDMQSLNHVMRDPALFRRVNAKHYRHGTKYKVWPLYDFYNPIEDSLMGVTLILRSNEFDTRVELQDRLKDLLKLKKQTIIQYGRFNVEDFTTKGREIRDLIQSGELLGWDDPRLITLKALKRRGITREALYELTKQIGLSKHPVNLQFDMIAAINRKLIDAVADRYAFIQDPVELKLDDVKMKRIEIPVHPDYPEKTRAIDIEGVIISKKDTELYKGKEIRLLHLCNIKLDKKLTITSYENKKIPKIQWVSQGVKARVLMPNGQWAEGVAEKAVQSLKSGTLLQFERFGFVSFDRVNQDTYEFWYAHS